MKNTNNSNNKNNVNGKKKEDLSIGQAIGVVGFLILCAWYQGAVRQSDSAERWTKFNNCENNGGAVCGIYLKN